MTIRTGQLVIVGTLIVASGVVHGWWTNRWAAAGPAVEGRNLLDSADPLGDWRPGEFIDPNPDDLPPGCRVCSRGYTSARSGKSIVVSVTSGHAGVVAVHTPDVCYLGSGYKLKSAVRQETIPIGSDGKSASCYVADFQKNSTTGSEAIRVRWAWTDDGNWLAPNYPRWFFARAPILYKVYVVHPLGEDDLTNDEPYRTFVASLLPTLSRHFTH